MSTPIITHRTAAVFTRVTAVVITAGVGIASFALSFAALRDLAVRGHIPVDQAWLWPLVVDGTIMLATMGVIVMASYPGHPAKRFFWIVLAVSAIVSIVCNALHAILPSGQPLSPWLTGFLAAVAPAALLATTHGLSVLTRLQSAHATTAVPATPDTCGTDSSGGYGQLAQEGVSSGADVTASEHDQSPVAIQDRAEESPAGPPAAASRWQALAPQVLARASLREAGVERVAQVLHLGFEDSLTNREIGRRMQMSHHTVGKIQSVGSQLLAEQQHSAVA